MPEPDDLTLAPYRARVAAALAGVADDDAAAVYDALDRAGLGDGLPVLPPTGRRLAGLLDGRDADAPAGTGPVPISFAQPTWGDLATAAALAGCPPGSLGLVAAALAATTEPEFNLLGVQATTGAASPLVVVHGPVVAARGLNCGADALGSGFRTNLTIGRAVRLALADIGCCRPGEADMATHGHPGKVAWLVAEHQQASPWAPFSVVRGGEEDASGVTVFAGVGNVELVLPTTAPAAIADLVGRALAGIGCRRALLLVPPESASFLHRHGWGRDELGAALGSRVAHGVAPLLVVVTGGTGIKATLVPGWGGPSEPVTRWLGGGR